MKCAQSAVVFMSLFRVAYVWTRGRVWLRDQKRRDARSSWRIRVLLFACPRVFVWKRLSNEVPLVLRVYLFSVVSRVRASRSKWSRKRRTLHAFTYVVRLWASHAFLTVSEHRISRPVNRCVVSCVRRIWLKAAVVRGAAECLFVLVGCPKKKTRGCRRLVIIRDRDATVSRERFRTHRNS